jgi:hypothetical protein
VYDEWGPDNKKTALSAHQALAAVACALGSLFVLRGVIGWFDDREIPEYVGRPGPIHKAIHNQAGKPIDQAAMRLLDQDMKRWLTTEEGKMWLNTPKGQEWKAARGSQPPFV